MRQHGQESGRRIVPLWSPGAHGSNRQLEWTHTGQWKGEIEVVDDFRALAEFIWSVADLLRGDFKRSQFGRVILPFVYKFSFYPTPGVSGDLDYAAS